MYKLITLLLTLLLLLVGGHGLGPGPGGVPQKFLQEQMQSRAVDTRVTFEIPEGQPKGTYVGRIPTKSGFTYRFNEAPKEFHLDPETGDIKTIIILDREILKNDRFDLVILSSQPTYPIEVRISVIDINDNSPEFPESSIAISFSENAVVGTRLLLDAATDKDIGENGISENYQIIAGNDNEKFKLIVTPNPSGDSSYLHLETTGKLDREIQEFYSLNVCAQDGGKPTPKYGYLQVNVTIQDVNDNPPIFDQSDYTVSLNESVPPGSAVLQVTATDNDLGDNARITYYLQDTKEFAIDPETGIISTNEHLKCEEQKCVKPAGRTRCLKSCAFTVLARDHGSPDQDGRTYVTINLLQDSNDHSPVIKFRYNPDRQQYSIVDENAVNGTLVAGVYVVDDDDGSNGETSVKIVSGNEANNFQLENSAVRVNGVLDREEISKYNLTFIATDKGNPPRTTTAFLVIYVNDVNDHEPVFEKSEYSAILSESAPPGTYVTAIGASDEDTGVNAQIYYAIISGNDNQWFHINQETGLITTETDLDREIQDTVELNISARDGGPNPKWAYTQLKVMILDKNDDAPKFSLSKINVSLSENEPSGTLVAMLTATDRDQGTNGSVSYSLHSDVYENYKDAFFLDTVTGKLSTKRKLDREENSLYEIQVVAKDQGIPSSQSSTATVFLTVTDVNDNAPIFYPQNYFAPISDNLKIGSSILKVTAFDLDDGDNSKIIYMLKDSSEELFSINDFTGVITLEGNIKINSKPIYRLVVTASDKGGQFSSEDAIVEIIKESYMEDLNFNSFTGYNFVILEDPDGISLKKRDVGMVDVRNREAIYSIAYGDPNKNFHINDHTGKIITNKLIDREQTVNYKLTIVARTKLGYGKTTVNINIQDLNDNRPSFPKNNDDIKLAENTAVGHEIYLAKAKDLDLGINSRILYQLTYNPDDQFRIAATTGVVYLNKPITTEPNSINHLEITATDSGSPQLSSKMTLNIIIADVNDHTPVFDHTSYETSLPESTKINDRFFALAATDADLDLNGRISYEITEGNAENKFGVFPDGFLYLRKTLDREEKDYYSLIVIAKDLGNPSRFSSVPVVIHVIDENDNAPQFTNSTFTFYVQENQPIDSFVGKLSAYDKDIGRNAELIFSLAAVENDFAIDPKNGFLRTSRIFDREELVHNNQRTSFLTLEAIVTDNGTPRLKEKVRINVHITDENDNAPEFLRTPYKIQISEGSNVGSQIFRVYTIDIDEGLNGDVFYSIVGGNEERKFEIHDTTGQIILVKHLDRETTSKYSIKIRAHDVGVPSQLDSTAIVVIEVLDENDNTPEFTQSESQISVNEITSINSELICFKAIDNDLGVNSEVTYSITAGNRKDTFHIDEISGVLYLHKSLDYEELPIYLLNITAFDNGSPKLSTTILFSIAVEDANDNPPNFPNTAIVRQLKEGIPVFTPIVTVTASDPDSGVNGNVTYSISYQEPDDSNRYFDINPITGVVRTLRLIDRESIDTFRLTVVATDRAEPPLTRLSADKLVTVIVEDINDNMPIFVSMNAAVLPNQNNSVYRQGTTIMQVFARDIDSATNGLVSYELINDTNDLFMLDQNSGILKLKKSLHSLDSTYRISVKATDEAVQSERRSSEAYITIITDDGNEISGPVFEAVSFSGSVFENEPPGTSIVTINAKYLSDPIEYYITNITSDAGVQVDRFFDIELKNGILSTAVELDRETGVDIYLVEIYAIVGTGHAKKTSKTHVQITVLDKNDSPPTFKSTKKRYTVSEELGPGQSFALIKAEDPDTIGELKYSIVKGDDGKFNMDSQSGELKVIDSLDRETKDVYKITIRCNDGQQFTDTLIIIEINDTNDNPPVFLEQAYSFDIPENTARGFRVGQIKANDADLGVNAQLTYTVISDWANDVFSLNPQTGVFTLTSKLDYEEVQHYILVVQAQDSGIPPLSSTLTVYCNVLDLNDNSPIFDPMSYSNEILENVTIGSSVVTVSATDSDSGNNGKIVCTITAGDPIGQFQISSNGTITTARNLDRETISIYNLIITATDQPTSPQQSLSSTVQVTIIIKDVNDMSPEFVTPNETFVQENILRNTMVMPIKAIDKDEGRNGYIEYLLSPNAYFVLGSVDGTLRVAGNIDRELQNNFTITVTARDRGDPPRSTNTSIVIKVLDENDNSPVFDPKRYSANIAENASIGAMVLQVSATDIDDGLNGRVRYSISHGDANRDFGIAEDTGVIRVAKNLNYERRSQYILTVKAEDCAGDINEGIVKSDTAEITISVTDINDNPPTFLDSPYLAYVMENIAPNGAYYVINVQAYDADTPPFNNLVRYFIKEGDTDIFRINASTGDVSLLRPLDREVQEKYTLSLVAMDTGSPPLTGSGILQIIVQDVNDHSPEFKRQSYQASIKENLPIGSWVLNVLASDKDIGLNGQIRYSLSGEKLDAFNVDPDKGVISTNAILDREDTELYVLSLIAQDCSATEPRRTIVNLTITVLDENDNSPVFLFNKYEVYISDQTKAKDFVFGAQATDKDAGINNKIVYSISGEHAHNFMINPSTGVIMAHKDLRKLPSNNFNLEMEARDSGNPPKSTSSVLKIYLKPNHLFPRWNPLGKTDFILPENVEQGQVIAKFKASSPKKGNIADIKYGIAGGNVGDSIQIDSNTGEIQVMDNGLDYEVSNSYQVWIEAHDSDVPPLRSVLLLTINLTDYNDNPPIMLNQLYNATVMEPEYEPNPSPLFVTKIKATDIDTGENGQISYKLLDDIDETFEIDSETGEIYANKLLDRETMENYDLTVIAEDHGIPQLSGTATVLVTVLDRNDNGPRFTRLFSVNVTENAEIGSFVIQITSSDRDIGENAKATYSFRENPGEKFKINPITGNVTVIGHLDREQQDEYLLSVTATDGYHSVNTHLTITIQDQNDNSPEFEQSYYSFNFPELQRNVVFVGQVIATDRDKQGPNSVISYSLHQPSDLFTVDPATGEIFSKQSIRYKYTRMEFSPENTYSLTILATDNGKPPMSSECTVTVNVVDANNNAPQFEQHEYLSPVPLDAFPGQQLLQVKAIDQFDAGVNAEIEYSNAAGNSSELFIVNKNDGWISLRQNVKYLGEIYILRIRATDRGIPAQTDETTVTFIVTGDNKFTPDFNASSYKVFVPENEPLGSTILLVNATDEDNGPNGIIRYEISAGNDANKFEIDSVTGAVSILETLDYDTVKTYYLNITAYDLGFKRKKSTVILTIDLTDINDNSPKFNQTLYDGYILENQLPGTLVYQITATDIDSPKNAKIVYTIADGCDKSYFNIEPSSGKITSMISFDYEEKDLYKLTIIASNPDSSMRGQTESNIHIIGVNEYYPKFVKSTFHFAVSESADIGTKIGTILATDQDSGENGKVYYLLVGSSNDRGFILNSETGEIRLSRSLDRETQNRIVLTVMAKNTGGIRGNDTDEAQVIISVQDGNDPPEFLQKIYQAQVSEGAIIGTKVLTVKAVDKDVLLQNSQFGYSIIGGNIEQSFKIHPQSGDIQTAKDLDRETISMYTLIIGAIDLGQPPQTGTTTIKINISDINDNGPIFDPPQVIGKVMENEPAFTAVMTLSATDSDLPPNGAPFIYTLIGGEHKDYVQIDKYTGVVLTTKSIDREKVPELNLIVEVEDSGIPPLKTQHPVNVIVLDENDSESSARSVHIIIYTFKGEFPSGLIGNVHPNDPDITGDYKCKILTQFGNNDMFIPNGCNLYASKNTIMQDYSLSVSSHDGKHKSVVSTVTVNFLTFDNTTIENSLAILIKDMPAVKFVRHYYGGFLNLIKNILNRDESIILYSIYEGENGLEITMALKSGSTFKSKFYLKEKLLKKHDNIQGLLETHDFIIGYSPCNTNICENGGICTETFIAKRNTTITDTESLIFTSPSILHDFNCQCIGGFTGRTCNTRQDPCLPNPCKNNGQCHEGLTNNYHCICLHNKEGKHCELDRVDVCSENPCQNGGTCKESPDGSSFFCLCRSGYRGNQCEVLADSCRPNPCLHDGLCINLMPGYKCSCTDGRYGRHCEKTTYGFQELSYMVFGSLDATTNDISVIFATTKPNSLLVYNYGSENLGRSDFVAIELLQGRAVFSFGGARTAITSINATAKKSDNLADGNWYKISATRNGKVISLNVGSCNDNGDVCEDCKPNDEDCYIENSGDTGTLNFNNQLLLIGGLENPDPVLERPGQIHSDDFIGCIHSISINGRQLNLNHPIRSTGVENKCSRKPSCRRDSVTSCGDNVECIDQWSHSLCKCNKVIIAPNCYKALQSVSLTENGFIEFSISKKHKRMQLLEFMYGGSTLWLHQQHSTRIATSHLYTPDKSISLMFRTIKKNGILLFSTSNKYYTSVEIVNGQIVYTSKTSNLVNLTDSQRSSSVADGEWHNITLNIKFRTLKIFLDSQQIGELGSTGVHDFLDPYLTYLSIGGVQRGFYYLNNSSLEYFRGCIANFTINNEIQPFNGSGTIFQETISHGKILQGCNGILGLTNASIQDPLSIGITLVIVFFVVLLIAILVSFIVFRLRKQYKEKSGSPNSSSNGIHTKQNGAQNIGINSVNEAVLSRGLHAMETSLSYHNDGDVIRGIGGHSLVGPELLPKKFKERDILQGIDPPRPQRPDIIEREVVTKSPPIREDHHPPLPPSSNHIHDHGNNDLGSELPEHYDLENASSIAPSDIDIVYHYKGYREGGGVRKYKATPPNVASYHHKHNSANNQAQHRHSPHHPTGGFSRFPPRAPPSVAATTNRGHQSTPLARLSPSSEMSAQQPRILTLHDISGKPLQTALLATTSSSGGVGKDVLHSNSERSLNSPVMSQLSGQSSNRKTAAPPAVTSNSAAMGLTAEEIERLNQRPRNSSLVSTLDAVSSSSEARVGGTNHLSSHLRHSPVPETRHSSTSTDESGNDSFTCSEIEYDNASLPGDDKYKSNQLESHRNDSSNGSKSNIPPPSYDGFDSSYRGSMSTLVASDDDLGGPMYRPRPGSPPTLGWDYLLNWGPNYESLAGVFKDIAESSDNNGVNNNRVPNSLRLTNNNSKPSEEYV